jgi:negative modulator of initiation of replication
MKTIQIEDDLYHYIASKTENIGESASAILRRLLIEQQGNGQPVVLEPLTDVQNELIDDAVESDEQIDTGHSVFNILNKEEVTTQKGAVGRFLFILSALHRSHPSQFHKVLEVKGRERAYFAKSAEELNASGSSIKPKPIADSVYWVTTNNNTPRKKLIITQTAMALGYTEEQAEKLRELI